MKKWALEREISESSSADFVNWKDVFRGGGGGGLETHRPRTDAQAPPHVRKKKRAGGGHIHMLD